MCFASPKSSIRKVGHSLCLRRLAALSLSESDRTELGPCGLSWRAACSLRTCSFSLLAWNEVRSQHPTEGLRNKQKSRCTYASRMERGSCLWTLLKSVDSPRGTQSLSMTNTRLRQLKKLLSINSLWNLHTHTHTQLRIKWNRKAIQFLLFKNHRFLVLRGHFRNDLVQYSSFYSWGNWGIIKT